MSAMSGGCPPATAVESTVGRLFPTGLYCTCTFGYCLLKPSITCWNCFWPVDEVQMPSKVTVPETFDAVVPVVLPDELFEPPPQPAATATSAATAPAAAAIRTTRVLPVGLPLTLKLLPRSFSRRRFPRSSRCRRSGARGYRPRPRPASPPRRLLVN